MISEEAISFILTFVSYNGATKDTPDGVIVDKVIESEYYGGRKMLLEFESPVILTQKKE